MKLIDSDDVGYLWGIALGGLLAVFFQPVWWEVLVWVPVAASTLVVLRLILRRWQRWRHQPEVTWRCLTCGLVVTMSPSLATPGMLQQLAENHGSHDVHSDSPWESPL